MEWSISDFIKDCPVGANIALFPNSLEFVDIDKNNEDYLLFSYSKNCRGRIDPGDIKYFAYHHGHKYVLKGEETIIIGKNKFGGEAQITISPNLLTNLPLLNYMLKKWSTVSTIDYNKQ